MNRDIRTDRVIVFNRLRVPSADVIGEHKPLKMIVPAEPFVASNVAGGLRQVESREEVGKLGRAAGKRLAKLLAETP